MADIIDIFFNPIIWHSIVATATFFLLPTLGEIFAERSGILNLGNEGMIISSAAGSYAMAFITNNIFIGILFGMFIGGFLASIHAVVSITFNRNQIVSGIGLTILGAGLSGFLGREVIGKSFTGLDIISIPLLSELPFIGSVFFQHNFLVYLSYLLVPLLWFVLFKTRIGILIRTVGENPSAAYNQGVNVRLIRYLCVIFGGTLAGLAGAYLSLGWLGFWSEGMTNGRGWIVIALVVVALWNPLGAVFGAYLFGYFDVSQFSFQQIAIPFIFPSGIPTAILKMMPSLFTIIFLALWAFILTKQKVKSTLGAPTSLAVPFED
ncbi:MAG: ABC transporter permease [Candidatus Hodarchaeales archaeon]|jgi:simple sugar transport system permease protein